MENIPQTPATFQFTNLTNRNSTKTQQQKKTHLARAKAFFGAHSKPDPSAENKNGNVSALGYTNPFDFKVSTSNLAPADTEPTHFQSKTKRSLKKVNIDYFRTKKVIFKHSNVRISFEIVQSLTN